MRKETKHELINRDLSKINFSKIVENLHTTIEFTDNDIKRAAKPQFDGGVHLNGAFFNLVISPLTSKLAGEGLLETKRVSGVRFYSISDREKAIAVLSGGSRPSKRVASSPAAPVSEKIAEAAKAVEVFTIPEIKRPKNSHFTEEEYMSRLTTLSIAWVLLAISIKNGDCSSTKINKMIKVTKIDLDTVKKSLNTLSNEQIICMSSGVGRGSKIELSVNPDELIEWARAYFMKVTHYSMVGLEALKRGVIDAETFYNHNMKPNEEEKKDEKPVPVIPVQAPAPAPIVTPKKPVVVKKAVTPFDSPEVIWKKSLIISTLRKCVDYAPTRLDNLVSMIKTERGIQMSRSEVSSLCREMQRDFGNISFLPGDVIRIDNATSLEIHYHLSKLKDTFHVISKMDIVEFSERYNFNQEDVSLVMNDDARFLYEISGTREARFEKAIVSIIKDLRNGEKIIGSSFLVDRVLKGETTKDLERYINYKL